MKVVNLQLVLVPDVDQEHVRTLLLDCGHPDAVHIVLDTLFENDQYPRAKRNRSISTGATTADCGQVS